MLKPTIKPFAKAFHRALTGPRRGGLGPELAPTIGTGTGYTLSLNAGPAGSVTHDGTGIHFIAANNLAAASVAVPAMEDNVTYRVAFTMANRTNGAGRVLCYGDTSAHLGATPAQSANGVYVFYVVTNAAGSNNNEIRIQATGANGTNSFDITSLSVRKVM